MIFVAVILALSGTVPEKPPKVENGVVIVEQNYPYKVTTENNIITVVAP